MLTVKKLISLLVQLPPETRIYSAESHGISPVEGGELMPFKVLDTRFGTVMYVDDGLGLHGSISDNWVPLDEFVAPCES